MSHLSINQLVAYAQAIIDSPTAKRDDAEFIGYIKQLSHMAIRAVHLANNPGLGRHIAKKVAELKSNMADKPSRCRSIPPEQEGERRRSGYIRRVWAQVPEAMAPPPPPESEPETEVLTDTDGEMLTDADVYSDQAYYLDDEAEEETSGGETSDMETSDDEIIFVREVIRID